MAPNHWWTHVDPTYESTDYRGLTVMDENGTSPAKPLRRHLLTPEALARGAVIGQGADLTRRHGQGNGMRVHALYFAAVSFVALLLIVAAVAFAGPMT